MRTFCCAHCGKPATTTPRRGAKFCGLECSYAHKRGVARPHERGAANANWRGGRSNHAGYVVVYRPGHPRAHNGYVFEHILVVERAMGKPLPATAQVHHVDEVRDHNVGGNLVACQDRAYHALLHRRTKALEACGHADWWKCTVCKQWGPVGEVAVYGRTAVHRTCNAARVRRIKEARLAHTTEISC